MLKANDAAALIECFLDVYCDHWLDTLPPARSAAGTRRGSPVRPAVLVTRLAPMVFDLVHQVGEDPKDLEASHVLDPAKRQRVARACLRARNTYVSKAATSVSPSADSWG
jgi:hypothetical protein